MKIKIDTTFTEGYELKHEGYGGEWYEVPESLVVSFQSAKTKYFALLQQIRGIVEIEEHRKKEAEDVRAAVADEGREETSDEITEK